jgi:hypothetical protein
MSKQSFISLVLLFFSVQISSIQEIAKAETPVTLNYHRRLIILPIVLNLIERVGEF